MKSYSTVIPGKKMSQFVDLPEDFQKYDLEVVVKPIIKKKKQTKSKTSSEAVFLLSMAGKFNSGGNTTSEHVHEIAQEFVVSRHEKDSNHR